MPLNEDMSTHTRFIGPKREASVELLEAELQSETYSSAPQPRESSPAARESQDTSSLGNALTHPVYTSLANCNRDQSLYLQTSVREVLFNHVKDTVRKGVEHGKDMGSWPAIISV